MYQLITQLARYLNVDAETMHNIGLKSLSIASRNQFVLGLLKRRYGYQDPRLAVVNPFGSDYPITFSNPLLVAAGLDKNGVAGPAFAAVGFAGTEFGTVTHLGQPGNPRPRVFALPSEQSLINKMGFPGPGADAVRSNLERSGLIPYIKGINIGPNKVSVERGVEAVIEDCCYSLRTLADLADYFTFNVTSPNTPGMRELGSQYRCLLDAVRTERDRHATTKPLVIKVAPMVDTPPDISVDLLEYLAELPGVGIVATNTYQKRPHGLSGRHRDAGGGYSGRHTALATLQTVRWMSQVTQGALPVLATGLWDGPGAETVMRAGACLIQGYTGLVYRGPRMPGEVNRHLVAVIDREKVSSISELIGADSQ